MQSIIKELTEYLQKMQEFDKDSAQDAQVLHAYLIDLTQIVARADYLMAEYNREFRKEKTKVYEGLQSWSKAMGKNFSPMLAKDYVDSQCSNSGYLYDLAERCSRAAVHTIDAVRTIVSSLKTERQFANYS